MLMLMYVPRLTRHLTKTKRLEIVVRKLNRRKIPTDVQNIDIQNTSKNINTF